MKILVTGSSGFIGFHLSKRLLENGHKVHGVDSMNSYYDIKLKKARLSILKKYKNFSFTKTKIENEKKLKIAFKPDKIELLKCLLINREMLQRLEKKLPIVLKKVFLCKLKFKNRLFIF